MQKKAILEESQNKKYIRHTENKSMVEGLPY